VRRSLRQARSYAIYYGYAGVEQLWQYDAVVLHPGAHKPAELQTLKELDTITLAYLSMGEDANIEHPSQQPQTWWKPALDGQIQQNPEFGSVKVDPAHPEWQAQVLENAKKSLDLGFHGLFLDTLDSSDEADQLALAKLIVKLRARFPQIALVLNRGFRVLSRVAPIVDGALFEGLSTTWKMLPDGTVKYQKLEKAMRTANHQVAISVVSWAKQYGFVCWALDYVDNPQLQAFAKHQAEMLGFVSFTSNWQLLQIS
jgi:polysaccharide biosynthesis protein PelA